MIYIWQRMIYVFVHKHMCWELPIKYAVAYFGPAASRQPAPRSNTPDQRFAHKAIVATIAYCLVCISASLHNYLHLRVLHMSGGNSTLLQLYSPSFSHILPSPGAMSAFIPTTLSLLQIHCSEHTVPSFGVDIHVTTSSKGSLQSYEQH